MEFRNLGKTGIQVSEIGLGCWAIGGASFKAGEPTGWSGVNTQQSLETVGHSWDLAVSLYDTADAYGRGKSEVLLGMGLQDHKRQAVIATKVGVSLAAPEQNFTEPYIPGALDASMTRMEVDFIDLYQLHGPNVDTMTDELFGLMKDLKASGRIGAWGVSIANIDEGVKAIEGGAETIQLVYNILQQEIGDAIFPIAKKEGVGILVRVPLASGWLTGKYDANTVFPKDDHRSVRYPPPVAKELGAKAEQLDFLLDEADSLAEAALRFALADPVVSAVIPGAKTPEQAEQNAKASGKPLSQGALDRIKELFG